MGLIIVILLPFFNAPFLFCIHRLFFLIHALATRQNQLCFDLIEGDGVCVCVLWSIGGLHITTILFSLNDRAIHHNNMVASSLFSSSLSLWRSCMCIPLPSLAHTHTRLGKDWRAVLFHLGIFFFFPRRTSPLPPLCISCKETARRGLLNAHYTTSTTLLEFCSNFLSLPFLVDVAFPSPLPFVLE